jgi:glycosyltransferase involved in cell wall biosynthesis
VTDSQMTLTDQDVDISVVVPALDEAESLPELCGLIHETIVGMGQTYEVIVVDDGSTDGTAAIVKKLSEANPALHCIEFTRNYGKAAALSAGFAAVRGRYVVTMDADLQDNPGEIPDMIAKLEEGYDLVSGWKQRRKDSFIKNNTSKIFNAVTSMSTGLKLHDFNCGLKVYRREVTQAVRLYGEMHRYIPAQAHMQGYRVTEIPVHHQERKYGDTKYGSSRFINGFLDLMTLLFLSARSTSPLHFFGRIGVVLTLVGGGILSWFLIYWLTGHGLRIRPLMLLGVTLVILAMQFVSLGLIAELVVAGRNPESEYRVRQRF